MNNNEEFKDSLKEYTEYEVKETFKIMKDSDAELYKIFNKIKDTDVGISEQPKLHGWITPEYAVEMIKELQRFLERCQFTIIVAPTVEKKRIFGPA